MEAIINEAATELFKKFRQGIWAGCPDYAYADHWTETMKPVRSGDVEENIPVYEAKVVVPEGVLTLEVAAPGRQHVLYFGATMQCSKPRKLLWRFIGEQIDRQGSLEDLFVHASPEKKAYAVDELRMYLLQLAELTAPLTQDITRILGQLREYSEHQPAA